MIEEEKYETSFEIISLAGASKSTSFAAIQSAKEGKREEAEKLLRDAQGLMLKAHHLQVSMITSETRGDSVEVNIILVHAQDHLTMAQISLDFAEEFIGLYSEIQKLKGE